MAGYGPPLIDFTPLANIGLIYQQSYDAAQKRGRQERVEQASANIADRLRKGDTVDWNSAAADLFSAGQPDAGMSLLKVGQTFRKQDLERAASRDFQGVLTGAGGPDGINTTPLKTTMQKDQAAQSFDPSSIPSFVAAAGGEYGLSPDYMNRTAWIESRGNPRAKNASGASGLFQFMPQTAAQYGLSDPFDAKASASAAARLAADNREALRSSLGREPTDAELYLSHQQGSGGASALLGNPDAPAVDVLARVYDGNTARARKAILQNGGRLDMTAGDFAGLWTGKFNALGGPAPGTPAGQAPVRLASAGPNGEPFPTGPSTGAVTPSGAVLGKAPMTMPPAVSGEASADMPAPGAMDAQFVVPGSPQAAGPDQQRNQAMTAQVEAANQGGTGARITALNRVLSNPNLPKAQREVGMLYLKEAIDNAKMPPTVKEFMWARANGMTQAASPAAYEREKKGPTILSPNQMVYDPATNSARFQAPPSKDQSQQTEGNLRGELFKRLDTFNDVHDAYGRVISAVQQREANPSALSPASDISLVFGFMKMLDPGSVVREGEYATAKNAAGIPEVVRNIYNKAVNGEFLTPEQRQDMVESSGRLYGQARTQAEGVAERYRGLAKQYGADPDRAVYLPPPLEAPKVGSQRGATGSQQQRQGAPVRVMSPADRDQLAPGTLYEAPDGTILRKK